MTVAGLIPMHTPEEAIAELEHIRRIGLKVGCIASYVAPPVPQFADASPEIRHRIRFIDAYGIDSPHDYDPFWKRVVDLQTVPLACHSPSMGFSDRASSSNYMFNHCGHFAASGRSAGEVAVLRGRHQPLPPIARRIARRGVAVGVRLYGDLVARWKKRGGAQHGPAQPRQHRPGPLCRVDRDYGSDLARFAPTNRRRRWAPAATRTRRLRPQWSAHRRRNSRPVLQQLLLGLRGRRSARRDRLRSAGQPLGARVPAIMGSDIGHWDVPDFSEPLEEAWELVEHGLLDEEQFRDFVFTNQVKLYGVDPDFFRGTVIESAVAAAG